MLSLDESLFPSNRSKKFLIRLDVKPRATKTNLIHVDEILMTDRGFKKGAPRLMVNKYMHLPPVQIRNVHTSSYRSKYCACLSGKYTSQNLLRIAPIKNSIQKTLNACISLKTAQIFRLTEKFKLKKKTVFVENRIFLTKKSHRFRDLFKITILTLRYTGFTEKENHFVKNWFLKPGQKINKHPVGSPAPISGTANFRGAHTLMHVLKKW